ncbi:aspartate carbamoyltransferase [Lottiidibacillus patelloidae]|uniref:Aspartate carbamoyltransferase n=1 Tax=Lottiidibacillus patelloidae TaxID=2670334 RepID=A0A263BXT0_9BACI|nr:aspartate carbamoyltransferase catalytic subunit [Lottiidibacillus patelloidae]OZM58525.1 aspartate carbamoyltransferase [Lottiidibacillus patelloidae]
MHITTLNNMTIEELQSVLSAAKKFAEGKQWELEQQMFIANLFYENSTRTKLSFEVAEQKLGFKILNVDVHTSSVQKGESLYDTVKTLEAIGVDAVVIRHPEENYFKTLIENINIPIINGGDGCGNHPTQSLLDLYTIFEHFNRFTNLNVVICGDLRHSRVARSNAEVLTRLGATVSYSGPEKWFDHTLPKGEFLTMDEAVKHADVLMLLRIQEERHQQANNEKDTSYLEQYGLTVERERKMKQNSIIMHPAPVNRGFEIADELVECHRSKIFRQMSNGVFVRMAVLKFALQNGKV